MFRIINYNLPGHLQQQILNMMNRIFSIGFQLNYDPHHQLILVNVMDMLLHLTAKNVRKFIENLSVHKVLWWLYYKFCLKFLHLTARTYFEFDKKIDEQILKIKKKLKIKIFFLKYIFLVWSVAPYSPGVQVIFLKYRTVARISVYTSPFLLPILRNSPVWIPLWLWIIFCWN